MQDDLLQKLSRLRSAVRVRLILFGVCIVGLWAVVGFLLLAAVDWMFRLPAPLRAGLGIAYLGFIAWAVAYWVLDPYRAPMSLLEIAGRLDAFYGNLHDRLSSAVHFLQNPTDASKPLVARMVDNTRRITSRLRFADALSYGGLAKVGALFLAAGIMLTSTLAFAPRWAGVGFQRYLLPFSRVEWPKNVQIVALTGDLLVAEGDPVTLEMEVVRGRTDSLRAYCHISDTAGKRIRHAMEQGSEGRYRWTIPGVTAPLAYWFEAGDDSTRSWSGKIRVVHRPAVLDATLHVTPPAYTGRREPVVYPLGHTPIIVGLASRLAVSVLSNKPSGRDETGALRAFVEFDDASKVRMHLDEQTPPRLSAVFPAATDLSFKISLVDEHGFDNRSPTTHRIVVQPDAPPTVTVLQPGPLVEVTPGSDLEVIVRCEDDYGLTSVRLVAQASGQGQPVDYELTDLARHSESAGRDVALATFVWNLEPLDLQPSQLVTYHLQALDNYSLDGAPNQVGRSDTMRLKIVSPTELAARLRDRFQLLRTRLRRLLFDQETAKDDTDALVARDADVALVSADREAAAMLGDRQRRVAAGAKIITEQFDRVVRLCDLNKIEEPELRNQFERLSADLTHAADGSMTEATRLLEDASALEDQPSFGRTLADAAANQQDAAAALRRMLDRMEQWGDSQDVLVKVQGVLDHQQSVTQDTARAGRKMVGVRPEQLTDEQQSQLRKLSRRQSRLAEEIQLITSRMKHLADLNRSQDPSTADALDQAVRAVQAYDVAGQMNTAAAAIERNRTAAAAEAQHTVEKGLREVLAGLEKRRMRKLAELAKRVERMEATVSYLVEQQRSILALTTEATQQAADADEYLHLSDRQQTLQRNTRQVADEIASMESADRASRLVGKAAGKMSSAVLRLRDSDGQAARNDQRDAVALLLEALDELNDLALKTEQEVYKRQMAAIRREIEELHAAQSDIRRRTSPIIDRRLAGKSLRRADTRRLGRLAREQAVLRDKVDDLKARLGNIAVMEWILSQVSDWMARVRQRMDAREIDAELARLQDDIITELNRLIGSLREIETTPVGDEFADAGGGAGGFALDDQGPQIPPLAELLLIKSIQIDINDRTKSLGRAKDWETAREEDLQELEKLGNRQRHLHNLTEKVVARARQRQP